MIGLVLIYWIGKKFSELAKSFGRKPVWPVIIGIVFYFLGQFVLGLIIGVYYELQEPGFKQFDDMVVNLIGIPFGLLACWGTYMFLEKKWRGSTVSEYDILDDEELLQ